MEINSQNVEIFYDLIDEACMEYYYDIHMDYLDAFCKVSEDILENFDIVNLTEDAINKLQDIYEKIFALNLLNEEIRLALVLIIVKGLKHRGLQLDVVLPDTVSYMIAYIIKMMFKDEPIKMIDTCLGIGSLALTICNNLENEIVLAGIEKEHLYAKISKAISDFLYCETKIYCQDYNMEIFDVCDVVIGDLDRVDNPYELILERLDNIKDGGKFVYIINNDFFNKHQEGFKEALSKEATLTGLIVLPDSLTQDGHVGKSILIGTKSVLSNFHMGILKVESLDKDHINDVFKNIKSMIEQMEV